MSGREVRRRWRLILGGHAEQARPAGKPGERGSAGAAGEGASGGATGKGAARLDALDRERDVLLEFLFRRERSRGGAGRGSRRHEARGAGGGDRGSLTPVTWLHEVRKVFPKSSVETLQRTAIDRYDLVDLLTDPEALKAAEPSLDLVGTLLAFRDSLPPAAMGEVRRIVGTVVREVEERLAQKIRQHFGGRRRRHQHGGRPLFANLDWRRTIARNLEHYDAGHETLVLERGTASPVNPIALF